MHGCCTILGEVNIIQNALTYWGMINGTYRIRGNENCILDTLFCLSSKSNED